MSPRGVEGPQEPGLGAQLVLGPREADTYPGRHHVLARGSLVCEGFSTTRRPWGFTVSDAAGRREGGFGPQKWAAHHR